MILTKKWSEYQEIEIIKRNQIEILVLKNITEMNN